MELFSYIAFAMIALILALFLKNHIEHISHILILVTIIILAYYFYSILSDIITEIRALINITNIEIYGVDTLLRAVLISILIKIIVEVCKDCGFSGLATQIELLGIATISLLSLPLFTYILNIVLNLV